MFSEHISVKLISFFIIYGITGAVPFFAALYLLLRRGNAFAPDVTPPLRLRRWAASFFAVAALGHLWWYLFIIYSRDIRSACYVVISVIDGLGVLITIAGTLFALLQDRRRSIWPIIVALIPYPVIGALYIVFSDEFYLYLAVAYILVFYAIFTIYIVIAMRRYGQWLNDNFADHENKKVWLTQLVSLICLFLFILYLFADTVPVMAYVLHAMQMVLFSLLLWRVETLPDLTLNSSLAGEGSECAQGQKQADELSTSHPSGRPEGKGQGGGLVIDLTQIAKLLAEHCVDTQLYLQHDLTLQQLAQAVGTNRSYLSQHFSRQGITYNTYINNLRINHFISRYQEVASAQQPFTVQQLASESGYRSYSTFSLAFKQRMGQSVTAWIRQEE